MVESIHTLDLESALQDLSPSLQPHHAHLWTLPLDLPPQDVHANALLSEEETRRAARFHFDEHRNRFILGRSILRLLLGKYLGVSPRQLQFAFGPYGKPDLAPPFSKAGVRFNLSHCDDLGLLAVTLGRRVGIDVERIRSLDDFDELVARFFSEREARQYEMVPAAEKPQAFFNLWTRKEAWLKATGEGISNFLHRVEVAFLPGETARILSVPPQLGSALDWQITSIQPAAGYVAALAVEEAGQITFQGWSLLDLLQKKNQSS